jgi:lipopolysaccharide biosynthesis glycosyltransferase
MEPIDVVLAADRNFSRQLAVTISGIARFSSGEPHRIFVFHDGYDAELRTMVEQSATSSIEIHWLDAVSAELDAAILPDYLPTATLYRLRITELLPRDVHRVLFLDTDIVVRGSLTDLWHTELDGHLLAAVRDPVYPWAASPECLDWRSLGVPADMPYFNAGVMVIPLDDWRAHEIGPKALDLLARHVFRYGDQCALNSAVRGMWKAVSPKWNVQSGHLHDNTLGWIVEATEELNLAIQDPTIVHFTWFLGWKKPWEERSTAPFRSVWLDELDRTAWRGWRPDDSPPSRTRMIAGRARRAGGVLLHG